MSHVKKIVCLANSIKLQGSCIAGKEILETGYGNWIRPISARPTAEISENECRLKNGEEPSLLDVLEIPLVGSKPYRHQSENFVIDATKRWVKTGKVAWKDVQKFIDTPTSLWINNESSYSGLNDRVKLESALNLSNSLALIAPEDLKIVVGREGDEFGEPKRRVRAEFSYCRENYRFAVTDPIIKHTFLNRADGSHKIDRSYLCVSLADDYQGYCYKLVAGVISENSL